jgi:hypothetical protein
MQFKIGDTITGKPGSDKMYGITNQKVHMIVKKIQENGNLHVRVMGGGFECGDFECGGLDPDYFLKINNRFQKYKDRLNGSLAKAKVSR